MSEKVMEYIKEHSMFDKGDKVIVAFSGGPDSACLLNILNEHKDELGITLFGAHLNHCLRGIESDMDAEYAKNTCENLNIDFYSRKIDVNIIAEQNNLSCEMAGRKARYDFFEELMIKLSASKIALAHNANDQAETILMRMMRGTGMEGLIGIRPIRDKIYVRPVLNLSRFEIEKYCEKNSINPRIDKSNLETIYARNKVRLDLIPYMEENFNKDIIKTLNRLSDIVKVDNDYLQTVSTIQFKKHCEILDQRVIIYNSAFAQHDAIVSRIIRSALLAVCHNLYNIEKVHIYNIIDLQKHETGKTTMLPQNIIAENCYGDIHIHIKENSYNNTNLDNNKEYALNVNVENFIHSLKKVVSIHTISKLNFNEVKTDAYIKYFDYDKIQKPLILRYRKDGDKFMPLGMTGNKKLKDLLMDLKIPKAKRSEIPLICFGDDIAWVVGHRVSEKFKISKNTKNILQIRIESEE